jgi:hypothetical protein
MPEDEHRMERERVWRDFLDESGIEPGSPENLMTGVQTRAE